MSIEKLIIEAIRLDYRSSYANDFLNDITSTCLSTDNSLLAITANVAAGYRNVHHSVGASGISPVLFIFEVKSRKLLPGFPILFNPNLFTFTQLDSLKFAHDNSRLYMGVPVSRVVEKVDLTGNICYSLPAFIGHVPPFIDPAPLGYQHLPSSHPFTPQSRLYTGSVVVLNRESDGSWRLNDHFCSRESQAGDMFGASLDLTKDDTRLIVGAPLTKIDNKPNCGRVHVCAYDEDNYRLREITALATGVTGDFYGAQVQFDKDNAVVSYGQVSKDDAIINGRI